jgi:shikimate dehydrogenase
VTAEPAAAATGPAAVRVAGPSASTRVAAVIGDPVRHSRSPLIHNAAFAATGLDWVYLALPVRAGDVARAFDGVRALGIEGLSVTTPHKDDAAAYVDELDDDARILGAVNCVVRDDERLIGANTDGPGLVASLRDAGFEPRGERCAVLGAGGAARSVVLALARAGASEVLVVNRTADRAERAAALATEAGSTGTVAPVDAVADAGLVVNATSIGMGSTSSGAVDPSSTELPLPGALVRADLVVADLVVHPVETPLLRLAAARGARRVDGLGMLVHQAALAFTRWTGVDAPLSVMQAAARSPRS